MNITLRQLQAFVEVAAFGNFTRAAKQLNVAQPAISRSVHELEMELGVRLFDRTTRRAELTEVGREFRTYAEKIIADLELAIVSANELVKRKRGSFTVGTTPLLASVLIVEAVAAFRREYPGVQVFLVDTGRDEIIARVKSGSIDVGIITFPLNEDQCVVKPLFRETLMLFCGAEHPLASLGQAKWKDVAHFPLVALPPNDGIRLLVEHGFKAAGLAPQPAYEVSQITTALAFVEAGLGVAVLPAYSLMSVKYRRIIMRPLSNPRVSRDAVVITRRDRTLPLAASDFMHLLQRQAKTLDTRYLIKS
jgi:DNA-binding transcriptional LysR family regulator